MRKSVAQHTQCVTFVRCQHLSGRQAKKYAREEAWNVPPWWPADGLGAMVSKGGGSRQKPSTRRKWRQADQRTQTTVKWRCKTWLIFYDLLVWELYLWDAGFEHFCLSQVCHATFKPILKGETTSPRIWDFCQLMEKKSSEIILKFVENVLWGGRASNLFHHPIFSPPPSFIDKNGLRKLFQNWFDLFC